MTTIKSIIIGLSLLLLLHSVLLTHGSKSKLHHRNKSKSDEKLNKRSFYYNSGKFRNLPLRKAVHASASSHTRSLYPNYNQGQYYPYPSPQAAYYPQPATYPASYSSYPAASSSYPSYHPPPAPAAASQVMLPEVYLYTSAYPGQSSYMHAAAANEDTQPNRNEIFTIGGKQFKSIGCWNDDMNARALKSQEGKHPLLKNPNYKSRSNALMKCAQVASQKNFKLFALQNGGQCFGQMNSVESYKKYGPSQNCKGDGEGGPLSNEVYSFVQNNKTLVPMEKNQSSGWSAWSSCAQPCNGAQGTQARYRPCNSPVPTNPCSGPVYETRGCSITLCLPSVIIGQSSTAAPSTAGTTGAPTTGASASSIMPATGSTTPPPSTTAAASSVMPATGSTTPSPPPSTTPTPPPPSSTQPPSPSPSPPPPPTTPPTPPPPPPIAPTTPSPKVCKATVDLGILMDGSGSIEAQGVGNFDKCKDFVKKLVDGFDVSPQGTHIGLILFNHDSKVEFGFDKFTDKQSIFKYVDGIVYPRGGTNTGKALQLAKTGLFDASSRKGVPNILVVMTDGKSGDRVTQPAQKLRDAAVTVFSIGVGNGFDEAQLKDMATDPDSEHVVTTGFDQLDGVIEKIKDKACKGAGGATQSPAVASTTQPPSPALPSPSPLPPAQAPCKAKVDLGFLLDASGSIQAPPNGAPGNFKKCLDFIVKMVQEFEISAGGTHIGLVRFDNNAKTIFDFKKFTDQSSVKTAVEGVTYTGGGTLTGQALTLAKNELFDASARSGVRHILIVMTDGVSFDSVDVPSKELRDSAVNIYSLGIGKNYNERQLEVMATDPDDKHVFKAEFDNLGSVVKIIKDQACKESNSGGTASTTQPPSPALPSPSPLPPAQAPCKAKVDLGFLLDASGSIQAPPNGAPGNFKKCLDFIVKMVQEFEISAGGTHIGLVRFDNNAKTIFDFKKFTDQSSVKTAVEGVTYTGGGTLTGQALTLAKNELFDASARSGVRHILIVMTDGVSFDSVDVPSKELRDSAVNIYSLGIGKNYNERQLEVMATDPDDKHVFKAEFDNLGSVVKIIKDQACKESNSGGTGTTTTSGSQTGTTSGGSQTGSITTGSSVSAACKITIDLGFLLHASSSIDVQHHFEYCKNFIIAMVRAFDIRAGGTHVGLVRFETKADVIFDFSKYTDESSVVAHVQKIQGRGGETNTANALDVAKNSLFDVSGRKGVKHILIVLTDGRANDHESVPDASRRLRNSGVSVFSIGVGTEYDFSELLDMAGNKYHVFTRSFEKLSGLVGTIKDKVCSTGADTPQESHSDKREAGQTKSQQEIVEVSDESDRNSNDKEKLKPANERPNSSETDSIKIAAEHLEEYPKPNSANKNIKMPLSKITSENQDKSNQQITVDEPETPTENSYVNKDERSNLDLDTENKILSHSSFKDDDNDMQLTTIDEPQSTKHFYGLSSSRDDTDSIQATEFVHGRPANNNKEEYVFTDDDFGKRRSHVQHRIAHKRSKMLRLKEHQKSRRTS